MSSEFPSLALGQFVAAWALEGRVGGGEGRCFGVGEGGARRKEGSGGQRGCWEEGVGPWRDQVRGVIVNLGALVH